MIENGTYHITPPLKNPAVRLFRPQLNTKVQLLPLLPRILLEASLLKHHRPIVHVQLS